MTRDTDPLILDAVDGALLSLANFLSYAELPDSAQQVRNILLLLKNVITTEQRTIRPIRQSDSESSKQKSPGNGQIYRSFLYPYG